MQALLASCSPSLHFLHIFLSAPGPFLSQAAMQASSTAEKNSSHGPSSSTAAQASDSPWAA